MKRVKHSEDPNKVLAVSKNGKDRRWMKKYGLKDDISYDDRLEHGDNEFGQKDTRNKIFEEHKKKYEDLVKRNDMTFEQKQAAHFKLLDEREEIIINYVQEYGFDFPQGFPYNEYIRNECFKGKRKDLIESLQEAVDEELNDYPVEYKIFGVTPTWDNEKDFTQGAIPSIKFTGLVGGNGDSPDIDKFNQDLEHIVKVLDTVRPEPDVVVKNLNKKMDTQVMVYIDHDTSLDDVAYYLARVKGQNSEEEKLAIYRKFKDHISDIPNVKNSELIDAVVIMDDDKYSSAIEQMSYFNPYEEEETEGVPRSYKNMLDLTEYMHQEGNFNIDQRLGIDPVNIQRGTATEESEVRRILRYPEDEPWDQNTFNGKNYLFDNYISGELEKHQQMIDSNKQKTIESVDNFIQKVSTNAINEVKSAKDEAIENPLKTTTGIIGNIEDTRSFISNLIDIFGKFKP